MPDIDCYVGWDVGGAHLKMAVVDEQGHLARVGQWPTPLWQGLDRLPAGINQAVGRLSDTGETIHAITMTGELVDSFTHRRDGVVAISHSIHGVLSAAHTRFYAGRRGFVEFQHCPDQYDYIASANWYATAGYVASRVNAGLLMDIGSTTTDIIAFANGNVLSNSVTDHDRLIRGELHYTGVVRTPVMAVVDQLPWGDNWCPVMNESFASLADVYRITGELPDRADLGPACDGKALDRPASIRRLLRMIGLDADTCSTGELSQIDQAAGHVADQHVQRCLEQTRRVLQFLERSQYKKSAITLVGAGCGRFLVHKIANALQLNYMDFENLIDTIPDQRRLAADCAAAVSVAQLMRLSL